ncbi:hypothetical protein ABGB12_30085 [Actinocorallia sp. B10E7]|uniref:hypothetical protein n=1 Tax=Actinocorallia sp. B10E7 TaxID=3153558 RepID=UPI00325F211C
MAHLIEIRPAEEGVPDLLLQVGDLLLVWAVGGRIRSGAETVEFLGPFSPGVLGTDQRLHTPEGLPGRVAFLARHPGRAEIELFSGVPWPEVRRTAFSLTVE